MLQDDGDLGWRSIAFFAKRLQPTELKYLVNEKECLGVLHALRSWRHDAQCENLQIATDDQGLVWLMDNSLLRKRLERWIWTIRNTSFSIEHRPGTTMVAAETLSREVVSPPTCAHCHDVLKILKETRELPSKEEMVETTNDAPAVFKRAEKDKTWHYNEDRLLFRRAMVGSRLYVPAILRRRKLAQYHGNQVHGQYKLCSRTHAHTRTTQRAILVAYNALGLHRAPGECTACKLAKTGRPTRRGRFQHYQVKRRGELVELDVLTVSPASTNGSAKILIIADAFFAPELGRRHAE